MPPLAGEAGGAVAGLQERRFRLPQLQLGCPELGLGSSSGLARSGACALLPLAGLLRFAVLLLLGWLKSKRYLAKQRFSAVGRIEAQ